MSNVGDPWKYATNVTPSDTVNLSSPARGLYIGTTGDVSVEMYGGGTIIFPNVPVGVLPVQCTRVNASGTTASNIRAGW